MFTICLLCNHYMFTIYSLVGRTIAPPSDMLYALYSMWCVGFCQSVGTYVFSTIRNTEELV